MNVLSISASISVTITDIWTKFGTKLKYHTVNTPEWSNSHNLKIQDAGCRHLGFLHYVKIKNVSSSGLDKDICIKFYGIMHWTLAYTTACTTVQPVITACTVVHAVLTVTVWTIVSCSNNFNTKLGSGLLVAVGLQEHLKNDADHVHRTTYYVPWTA